MRSVHSASSAFRRLVSFELRRFVTPFRMVLTMVSLVAMVVLARGNLLQQMAIAAPQLADDGMSVSPTAFDMAYLALNNQLITGIILPIVCGILCSDLVARDYSGGMRTLIACETRGASTYVAAKLVTAAVVCQGVVLLFIAACILVSCLLLDLAIAIEPSAWLASSGPQDSIWAQYGLIPMGWNYAALIVALVLGFGALETVLSWTAMAVCSFLKSPSAAPLVVALFYVIASQFESLVTSLGMLLGITSWIKTIGWIVDRLCLVNYRLGASFFQEFAGGAYQGYIAVASDVAAGTYPINNWASLLSMLAVLSAISMVLLLVHERRLHGRA